MARFANTERAREAYAMRENGKTFRAIGEHFGVGVQRARMLVAQHTRRMREQPKRSWSEGLSTLVRHSLYQAGIDSKEAVLCAVNDGTILNVSNIGKKGLAEIRQWLGLDAKDELLPPGIEKAIRYLEKYGYSVKAPSSPSSAGVVPK